MMYPARRSVGTGIEELVDEALCANNWSRKHAVGPIDRHLACIALKLNRLTGHRLLLQVETAPTLFAAAPIELSCIWPSPSYLPFQVGGNRTSAEPSHRGAGGDASGEALPKLPQL